MTPRLRRSTPSERLDSARHCARAPWLAIALAVFCDTATGQSRQPTVDYNTANDYYAAVATGRHRVVEQFHLGPCEQSLNARNFRKALAECDFILRIFPNHPRALHLTVKTCEQSKTPGCRLDEVFERAIAINPEASATFVIRGIYLHGSKQYPMAKQSYERALELDANSMNAHYNLGLLCLELKEYVCANDHAQRAYSLGSTLPGLRDKLQKSGHWNSSAQRQSSAPTDPLQAGGRSRADLARGA